MRHKLLAPALVGSLGRSAVAVVIDDGVAEHPVKPGNDALFVAHVGPPLQGAHEGRLQDVFGDNSRFDTGLEEGQELPVAIHQAFDGGGRKSGRHEHSVMFCEDVRQPL